MSNKKATWPPLTVDENQFMNMVYEYREIGYGRMMQMISGLWRDEVGDGAHCVSDTYSGHAAKVKRCEREGHDWCKGGAYDWCDRCGDCRSRG